MKGYDILYYILFILQLKMKITLKMMRNIFKRNKIQSYNNKFIIRLRNNIKKYSIVNLNVLVGDEHIEYPVIIRYNKEYVITSDDNTDVLNFNVKLSLQDKMLKVIDDGFGFNTSVYNGETVINITENLIGFKEY